MEKISVYEKNELSFIHNGIVLSDAVSCTNEEELNGKYVLELTHPIDENGKWEYLVEENIIKADGQLYRIHSTEKNLSYVYVYARHIFYDLLHNFLEDIRPTNINGSGALNWILTGTQYPHNFIGMSDIATLNTQYYIRKNPVEAMLGEDSLVTRWNGELVRDNYTIKLLTSRGSNKGAQIAYGKNMLGLEVQKNMDTVITRIMPVGRNGLLLPEKYIDSPLINNYAFPRIAKVELDIGINETTTEIQAFTLMRQACNDLYTINKVDIPYININTNLLLLENTEEYQHLKNLVKVELGDIVSCTDNPLNITFEAKVIRIKKDVLSNRNVEVELGQFKQGISDTLNNAIKDISEELKNSTSDLQKAIADATLLLTNALGGYVVKRPGEILIMDTEEIETATKVWRWNLNGLGYSDSGINGPYRLAITMDGKINADFVTTGTLDAGIVKTGVLTSDDNSTWINLDDGTFNLKDKVKFINDELSITLNDTDLEQTIDSLQLTNNNFSTRIQSIEANMNFEYMQDTAPENPSIGDVWFSTSNEVFIVNNLLMTVDEMTQIVNYYGNSLNKSYRWNGSEWDHVEDGAITELRQEVSGIEQTTDAISLRVTSVETDTTNLETRVSSAEQKITDEAIVSTVESKSNKYLPKTEAVETYSKKSEVTQTIDNLILQFGYDTVLNEFKKGISTFGINGLRIEHSDLPGQYSEYRADGAFRQYEYGEGAYLNDVYAVENIVSEIGRTNPIPVVIPLPQRFRGRNIKAILIPNDIYTGTVGTVASDGTSRYLFRRMRIVLKEVSRNLTTTTPTITVNAYTEITTDYADSGIDTRYQDLGFSLIIIGY